MPSPGACFAVAGALTVAAALVADVPGLPVVSSASASPASAAVLADPRRAGFAGRTDLVSPGSASTRFRRLDRRVYSPLCLALAAGALQLAASASRSVAATVRA